MKKIYVENDINRLISLIKKNTQILVHFDSYSSFDKEILTIGKKFDFILDNLTSEFTEQELYKIQNDLLFYYQSLKEIIDFIYDEFQSGNNSLFVNSNQQYPNTMAGDYSPVTASNVKRYVIPQKEIECYKEYLQGCIKGIIEEIKKVQEMQLRQTTQIYDCYKGLADKVIQEMLAGDEQLHLRQTQQHDAAIKNLIAVLDEV